MSKQLFIKDGYAISDMDSISSPEYYGYLDGIGNWYIIKVTDIDIVVEVRYCRGSNASPYITAWTNRTILTYDYFNIVFKLGG